MAQSFPLGRWRDHYLCREFRSWNENKLKEAQNRQIRTVLANFNFQKANCAEEVEQFQALEAYLVGRPGFPGMPASRLTEKLGHLLAR